MSNRFVVLTHKYDDSLLVSRLNRYSLFAWPVHHVLFIPALMLKWSVIAAKGERARRGSSIHRGNMGKSNGNGLLQLQLANKASHHVSQTDKT